MMDRKAPKGVRKDLVTEKNSATQNKSNKELSRF